MKKLILLVGITLFILSCQKKAANDSFTLNGTVSGVKEGKIYLKQWTGEETKSIDSVDLVNGAFSFKGKVEMPEAYIIGVADKGAFTVFVENTTIEVKINIDSMKTDVKGSATHDLYAGFKKEIEAIDKLQEPIYEQYKDAKKKKDEKLMNKYEKQMDSLDNIQKEIKTKFVANNSKSIIAPYITIRDLAYQVDLKGLQEIASKFDSTITKSKYVKFINDRIEILKKVEIGQPAPEFSQNDSTGKPIALSSFKGKYVLIDFWASWCGPCRQENPNNVAMYKKFNNKGFEIFGVSLDKSKEKWLEAIKKDGLTWAHVSDLKYWNNAIAKLYGVRSIPHTVLVDKEGIIIAKDLRGEELEKKLNELFK